MYIYNIYTYTHTHTHIYIYTLGMLIENRKSGFRFENRFSILKTGFRFYFFKIIFSIENCIMLKRNSWKGKFMHLFTVYELWLLEKQVEFKAVNSHTAALYLFWLVEALDSALTSRQIYRLTQAQWESDSAVNSHTAVPLIYSD